MVHFYESACFVKVGYFRSSESLAGNGFRPPRQFGEEFSTAFSDSGSLNTDAETRLLRLRLALRPLKAACIFAGSNAENT
jgi:hypothetical protein